MNKYRANKLREYIENSELIVINSHFKIRLSKELLKKYENNLYKTELDSLKKHIEKINALNIKYPANANPVFYLYIVPDSDFKELLNFSRSSIGGGKPVISYDLDGFNSSYGLSSNMLENTTSSAIQETVNTIHELAHLVHSMFFLGVDRFICEGFAEALPLYTMDYESIFNQHRELLKSLKKEQILSAQELIELGNNQFHAEPLIPNTSCSFELPYISSYLFVRGCLEKIANKFHLNRNEATQKFLEIVKQSECSSQWLVFDIANAIGISGTDLLNKKDMQFDMINYMA
ncbi:MAG: hypothetical protein HFH08_00600 [Bacilli bacterium]|nr:hypothetical protein [Bacilli bacterium]